MLLYNIAQYWVGTHPIFKDKANNNPINNFIYLLHIIIKTNMDKEEQYKIIWLHHEIHC